MCQAVARFRERERGMTVEINFNLNYSMRDGKILHKGRKFSGRRKWKVSRRTKKCKIKRNRSQRENFLFCMRFIICKGEDEPAVTREQIKCRWQ
jgi:hypothetical protein